LKNNVAQFPPEIYDSKVIATPGFSGFCSGALNEFLKVISKFNRVR
jgi:hypothetical protein